MITPPSEKIDVYPAIQALVPAQRRESCKTRSDSPDSKRHTKIKVDMSKLTLK